MTERAPPPARTAWIWIVLTLLLLFGTVSSAFVVYGLSDLASTGRWLPDALAIVGGGSLAILLFLFTAGILYRIDRIRGVIHRRIELFE